MTGRKTLRNYNEELERLTIKIFIDDYLEEKKEVSESNTA
jgi:hypothetical protein